MLILTLLRSERQEERREAANCREVKVLITTEMRTRKEEGKAVREEMHILQQMRAK